MTMLDRLTSFFLGFSCLCSYLEDKATLGFIWNDVSVHLNNLSPIFTLVSFMSLQAPKEKVASLMTSFLNQLLTDEIVNSRFDKRAFEHLPIVRRSGRWLRYVGQSFSGVVSELISEWDGWGRPCLFRQILTCNV